MLFRSTAAGRLGKLQGELPRFHNGVNLYHRGIKGHMARKKSIPVPEFALVLDYASVNNLNQNTQMAVVDTHTHLVSTFSAYMTKYPAGNHQTIHDFVRGFYLPQASSNPMLDYSATVTKLVDVYCEAPVMKQWKEVADSALTAEQRQGDWGGVEYYFVIGVHPHNASKYSDSVERDLMEALAHPRCVGMGEMGLDYHYDNSPRTIQQDVLIRQIQCATRLGKPLTIHTREADEDILRILKEYVPIDHKIHVHCFTDSPALAHDLLNHFPNLFIGVTGVVTFTSNVNTREVIEDMVKAICRDQDPDYGAAHKPEIRILLETDAPYMVPVNLPLDSMGLKSGARLPFSHSGMIPWTAEYVASVATAAANGQYAWTTADILAISERNAKTVYGI